MNKNEQYTTLQDLLLEHFDIMKWIISNKHNRNKGFQFMMLEKYNEILLGKVQIFCGIEPSKERMAKVIHNLFL